MVKNLVDSREYKQRKGTKRRELQNAKLKEARRAFETRKRVPSGTFTFVLASMRKKMGPQLTSKQVKNQFTSGQQNTMEWKGTIKKHIGER